MIASSANKSAMPATAQGALDCPLSTEIMKSIFFYRSSWPNVSSLPWISWIYPSYSPTTATGPRKTERTFLHFWLRFDLHYRADTMLQIPILLINKPASFLHRCCIPKAVKLAASRAIIWLLFLLSSALFAYGTWRVAKREMSTQARCPQAFSTAFVACTAIPQCIPRWAGTGVALPFATCDVTFQAAEYGLHNNCKRKGGGTWVKVQRCNCPHAPGL